MNADEYLLLYEKYISGNCDAEEERKLCAYQDKFRMLQEDPGQQTADDVELSERIYGRITSSLSEPSKTKIFLLSFFKIAAILAFAIGIGFLYHTYYDRSVPQSSASKTLVRRAIKPGTNTAQLTLSDGSVVDLNDAKDGVISTTDQAKISRNSGGSISYATNSSAPENATNTITVPAGGNYKVILPDGTSVWLNSVSTLNYPLTFKGKNRIVTLQGEGYFEVSKNPEKPFVVQVDAMTVTVLGTHFNINAYKEHTGIQTTLSEGSVRLSQASKSVTLVPGEQGSVDRQSALMTVAKVNTNKVMGWKNGYFMFQDDNIENIMEQIARWYDVDVEYRGDLSNKLFGGIYSRNKDINELLKGLELTGLVHFKIVGRRVIVMA
jgi:transmembrane sensor